MPSDLRSNVLKQTCWKKQQVCLRTYKLLLPPNIKGFNKDTIKLQVTNALTAFDNEFNSYPC